MSHFHTCHTSQTQRRAFTCGCVFALCLMGHILRWAPCVCPCVRSQTRTRAQRLVPFSSSIVLSTVFYLPLSYLSCRFDCVHTRSQLKILVWENLLISHTLLMSQSNKHKEPCSTQLLNRPTDSTSEQPDARTNKK